MARVSLPISATSRLRGHVINRRHSSQPQEPLRDVMNVSMVPPQHVLRQGFPYFPKMLVSSTAVLTADGSYVPELTYPWENIFDDEHTRFIAQENLFDDIANIWTPFFSSGVNYSFIWSGLIEPRLEVLEYRVGKLLYPMNSLRLPEAASLVSSFNSGMDDASSFMIAMAGTINSSEKASLLRVGDTAGNSITVDVSDRFFLRNQYGTNTLKPIKHPASMTPFYLVLLNDPAQTLLIVSDGTAHIKTAKIPNRDMTRSLNMWIGEDLAGKKTLDMNLFEVTIFPYAKGGEMNYQQIITAMADVYGSNG